ncbi:hypothetical protein PMAYCL1PPCAC_28275 [Pristionchus mayeri]|uniref:G protein-coupled receptor n=1 Tax=Pristionchus mayeri TaxID=1317129 RepID=A0AAN5IBH5_9BILA|nr:hypothetical protein PMAYCL1PPCAC_28275 [Pristionchus mayeri]
MATLFEIIPDLILCTLYIYLLLRIATASDAHFKTPFFVLLTTTGVYSVLCVLAYQLLLIYQFHEDYWTVVFYKPLYAGNSFGASGAMYGKVAIVIHRYFVMRRKDFSEKVLSMKAIRGVLIAQFVLSLLETAAIWPASYEYMNWNGREIIVGISRENTMILKGQAVLEYSLYIFCNSIFTILTSREMHRMRRMLKDTTATSRSIILQQRNMFIIVTVCSLTHLIKVVHQEFNHAREVERNLPIFEIWSF